MDGKAVVIRSSRSRGAVIVMGVGDFINNSKLVSFFSSLSRTYHDDNCAGCCQDQQTFYLSFVYAQSLNMALIDVKKQGKQKINRINKKT